MSNPYDPPGGYGNGPQDPPPGPEPVGDPYGPLPYSEQAYAGQPAQQPQDPYGQQNPYGQSSPYAQPHPGTPAMKTNSLAIASLVTSLAGLTGIFCGFLGLAAPVGLVLGIVARKQIKQNPYQSGEGLAMGGIITGAIISLMLLVFVVLYVAFYGWTFLAS